MSSFVLNKCFTSILLNTYFNVKTTPVVQSLEDIVERKDLPISGVVQYLMLFKKNFNNLNVDSLIKRIEKDDDNFPNPIISHKIAEKVIKSRSVLIASSFQREMFLIQNKYYHDKIVIANKYFQQIMVYHVKKQQPFSSEIHY